MPATLEHCTACDARPNVDRVPAGALHPAPDPLFLGFAFMVVVIRVTLKRMQ